MICDEKHVDSVYLKEPEIGLPCPGCKMGEFFNEETMECQKCEEGSYQENDYFNDRSYKVKCSECPAGKFAEKILTLDRFETMPKYMRTSCTTATHIGDIRLCDVTHGFHVNLDGYLDSGIGIA